jgi:hypothetical protein
MMFRVFLHDLSGVLDMALGFRVLKRYPAFRSLAAMEHVLSGV